MNPKDIARMITEDPDLFAEAKCPGCGLEDPDVYHGFNAVECPNPQCQFYNTKFSTPDTPSPVRSSIAYSVFNATTGDRKDFGRPVDVENFVKTMKSGHYGSITTYYSDEVALGLSKPGSPKGLGLTAANYEALENLLWASDPDSAKIWVETPFMSPIDSFKTYVPSDLAKKCGADYKQPLILHKKGRGVTPSLP